MAWEQPTESMVRRICEAVANRQTIEHAVAHDGYPTAEQVQGWIRTWPWVAERMEAAKRRAGLPQYTNS